MPLSAALTKSSNSQGVVVCVTSLVMALAQDHLDAYKLCYQKAVDRLNKVRSLIILCHSFNSRLRSLSWSMNIPELTHIIKYHHHGCK